MGKPDLDIGDVERLLGGVLEPDDSPPGYGRVAHLLRSARGAAGSAATAAVAVDSATYRRFKRKMVAIAVVLVAIPALLSGLNPLPAAASVRSYVADKLSELNAAAGFDNHPATPPTTDSANNAPTDEAPEVEAPDAGSREEIVPSDPHVDETDIPVPPENLPSLEGNGPPPTQTSPPREDQADDGRPADDPSTASSSANGNAHSNSSSSGNPGAPGDQGNTNGNNGGHGQSTFPHGPG
jgi:hypothetical protein